MILLTSAAAPAQETPAQQVANKIAQKLKDTLSLSELQHKKVLRIHHEMNEKKLLVRQQYQLRDSIASGLQRVENQRDSLYKEILSLQQYELYQQKKRSLVSNN